MANGKWRTLSGNTQHVASSLGEYRPTSRRIRRLGPMVKCATCSVLVLTTGIRAHAIANNHPRNPLVTYRRIATATGTAYLAR